MKNPVRDTRNRSFIARCRGIASRLSRLAVFSCIPCACLVWMTTDAGLPWDIQPARMILVGDPRSDVALTLLKASPATKIRLLLLVCLLSYWAALTSLLAIWAERCRRPPAFNAAKSMMLCACVMLSSLQPVLCGLAFPTVTELGAYGRACLRANYARSIACHVRFQRGLRVTFTGELTVIRRHDRPHEALILSARPQSGFHDGIGYRMTHNPAMSLFVIMLKSVDAAGAHQAMIVSWMPLNELHKAWLQHQGIGPSEMWACGDGVYFSRWR